MDNRLSWSRYLQPIARALGAAVLANALPVGRCVVQAFSTGSVAMVHGEPLRQRSCPASDRSALPRRNVPLGASRLETQTGSETLPRTGAEAWSIRTTLVSLFVSSQIESNPCPRLSRSRLDSGRPTEIGTRLVLILR